MSITKPVLIAELNRHNISAPATATVTQLKDLAERKGVLLHYSEDSLCKSICRQLGGANRQRSAIIDNSRVEWTHIPNGGSRPRGEAAKFKAMGVRPGWPDYQFIWGGENGRNELFVEVKTLSGSLQANQITFRNFCNDNGIPWALARSVGEFVEILRMYRVPLGGV